MAREELLTVKQVHEEYPDFSEQKINFAIRQKTLKAIKRGTKYYFTRSAWNEYIGIPSNDESIKKDLEISNLKNRITIYENQMKMLKSLIGTVSNLVGL